MRKKIISLILAITMAFLPLFQIVSTITAVSVVWDGSVADGFESGTGTEDDPYIIKTAPQLAYLAQTTNAGNSYEGKFFKLANDITLNSADMFARDAGGNITGAAEGKTPYEWTPIGTNQSKCFSGSLDGDNHEIIGIYINCENYFQGLFGYCVDATVKNLGVADGYVKGNYVVGGVVGYNYASSGTAMVENCYNTGTVYGGDYVGGVVGRNYAYIDTASSTVENCYNTGAVSGSRNGVGGVVGQNFAQSGTATVTNCYNAGAVSGDFEVGGVVGGNYADSGTATVGNCYNDGAVVGNNFYIGGVVGYNYANSGTAMVENCYKTGAVSGINGVGGVVGCNHTDSGGTATVKNCYNTSTVSGSDNVGGMVGTNYANSGTAMVENSYNTGTVYGGDYVGGVVGTNYANSGTAMVENSYNTGTVRSDNGVGGVVGGNYASSSAATATVANCYNTGNISGNSFTGEIVGENYEGAVSYCYYLDDSESSSGEGQFISEVSFVFSPALYSGSSNTITALTDAQMRTQASFVGFDFDTVWTMDGDPDYPYPELQAFTTASGEVDDADVWDGSVADGFESGTGTEDDPYIIKTAPQLAYLAQTTNAGNSYEGKFFELANNITLNSADMFARDADGNITGAAEGKMPHQWTPIGTGTYDSPSENNPFSGSFNGNEHVITGAYINTENESQGLFGYCKNVTIKNLGVSDGYIKGGSFTGGVVGYNCSISGISTLENCYNSNIVIGRSCVGGVIGYIDAVLGMATAENCYNTGTINGYNFVGGVIGYNFGKSLVTNNYNTGTVYGGEYVGGVVGDNCSYSSILTASIENSYNTGTISGEDSVGGVVGYSHDLSQITCCHNTGAVSGGGYVGGLVGKNEASTVVNCYNNGSVVGYECVGGVAGYNTAYSDDAVTIETCYNIGNISGNSFTGEIVGENYEGVVLYCYYLDDSESSSGEGQFISEVSFVSFPALYSDSSNTITALTDAQMRTQASFVGFDFDTVWTMDGDPDYPYPELRVFTSKPGEPEPHTHSYTETSRTEPSCTTSGMVVYTCSCGDSYTEPIPATGHTEGDWSVGTQATCTEAGTKYKNCIVCGTKIARDVVPALGHDFVDGECTRCHIHQYTIIIYYVYTDGTTAQPTVTKILLEGEKYSVESPVITNYTADKTVVSGTAVQSQNITVTYKKAESQIITSISSVDLGRVDYNTLYSSLPLPETVTATTASGKTVSLKVFWNSLDYSSTAFGEQTINGTVIAAYGYKFGCEAKTTAKLTITNNVIVSIPKMSLGRLPLGTSFDGLGVPATAAVVTQNGNTHYLPVVWDVYSYDSSAAGKHTIHGALTLESGYVLAEGVENDVEITFELSDVMYGTADIVFLIDTTGSMWDEIQNVKNNIKSFADMLEREGVSVRWALVEYRDITCDGLNSTKIIYSGSSKWYIDVNAYKDAISRLTVDGGGDREETVIDALKTATFLENRADAHSFYVVVTDADYKVNNQHGVSGMPEMIGELKANETVTSVVTKTIYYDVYRTLTDETGGILANIDGSFANELWKLSDLIVEDVVYGPIDHIEIATPPNKTEYFSGDYFDGTGMNVKAIYTSGSERIVSGYSVTPTKALSVSDTSIEINYRGKTALQAISVSQTHVSVTGVTVSPESLELRAGEKASVTVDVLPSNATNKNVTWSTDNPNVATVKNGVIEAFEPGTAIVTVFTDDRGFSASVTVNVSSEIVPASDIYLDTGSVELFVGDTRTVKATVLPADATDKTVIWTSEDESIASVDDAGNITAISEGETTVKVATSDNKHTAMVLVTVIKKDSSTPHYSIDDSKGYIGKNVEIYISIDNNPGIISLRNYITYDTEALELVSIENTGLLNGFTDPSNDIDSPYILRWADALATENNTLNGKIVKLTFKIKDEASEGKYEVTVNPIESRDYMGQKIVFTFASSFIEAVRVLFGDIDGDGDISDWDAILLQRYLAGWDVVINLDAADIDHDNEISDWDAIILERYLAGWDVSID